MTSYVALLRAVNVGGTGKLPMPELRVMCEAAGFHNVRTYIASGNVVFTCDKPAREVKAILELALRDYAGKAVGVLVRTAAEMAEILAANPFAAGAPNRTMTIFLDDPPPPAALDASSGKHDEEMALGRREIYIHYPNGMGRSKLHIPAARSGTARNMNTVAMLAEMCGG
ncbi:MAG TPA: DUF1697 domain-containing protein [Stellaceae bacterium]|jgi:uncharacterized protein (DUF1697 family)|nr:DUF1697 domain-containing protein [Stellaceae bacterium]